MEQVNVNNSQAQTENQTNLFNAQEEIAALKEKISALESRIEKASQSFGGRF